MKPLRILGRAAAFVGLLLAYAVVAPLAWLTRRRRPLPRWLVLAALVVLYLVARGGCAHERTLRVATFNIRNFGVDRTDVPRLIEVLSSLDADVVAVQEIQDPTRFGADVVARLTTPGRRYALALSECGGRSTMHVGFVYDAARVDLRGRREYPELDPDAGGTCRDGDRAGLLGEFAASGHAFDLLVVHLSAGSTEERAVRRRAQWDRALAIVARLRAEGAPAVAVLGDANSTGFFDDRWGERAFIDQRLHAAGMRLATEGLRCSEYYRPTRERLEPSLLDHIAVTPEFPAAAVARVRGYCAEVACQPLPGDQPPRDYTTVSDHCPVTVGW